MKDHHSKDNLRKFVSSHLGEDQILLGILQNTWGHLFLENFQTITFLAIFSHLIFLLLHFTPQTFCEQSRDLIGQNCANSLNLSLLELKNGTNHVGMKQM